jgi:hypothetical protein
VIDCVAQLIMMVVGGDRLPCSIGYCILVSGYESWTLVTAEHITSAEDLHNCIILFSSRAQNVIEPPRGGVRHQDQLERFSVKREHNQHT